MPGFLFLCATFARSIAAPASTDDAVASEEPVAETSVEAAAESDGEASSENGAAPTESTSTAPRGRIVVLSPTLEGTFDGDAEARLVASLVEGLERGGIAAAAAGDLGQGAVSCTDRNCLAQAAAASSATHVVVAVITAVDRDFHVAIKVYDAAGNAIALAKDDCEICGLTEVEALVSAKAARLAEGLSVELGPAMFSANSQPAGAMVSVDGVEVGKTPLEIPLEPGDHEVRLTREGFVAQSQVLSFSPGVRTQASFELAAIPRPTEDRRRTNLSAHRARPWGWVALGTGFAALSTGIVLVAVDGIEDKDRCSGSNVDADGDCKYVLHSKWAGASVSIAGAALLAAGTTILLVTRPTKRTTRANARATFGPGSIGVVGRF